MRDAYFDAQALLKISFDKEIDFLERAAAGGVTDLNYHRGRAERQRVRRHADTERSVADWRAQCADGQRLIGLRSEGSVEFVLWEID